MSKYKKEFLSIVEIENKKCQKCSKLKTTVEVVSDKLITFLEGLHTSNLSRQIYHPKYTSLKKSTVILDQILQNYLNDSLLHDVICEIFSSHGSESIKLTFAVSRHIKEPPTVLKILFQRGSYDSTTLGDTKNEVEVAIPFEYMFKQPSSN